ncbi:MAG: 2Fe-2S iron-sulfur cluster binding domain-containing protein [Spirochaetales bacterium]|uniref:2Fe-2S iron-sulfur cluster binding domain-containing protein n=1 Tax=Candidatus Thalassospirochaeta sargassi TaxID=3119039 RepID=A0AAJ1IC65_9SPIO|nr:2Fe-2S iron-sulfur cluster binding domain-containing protein [Spirochaetales bacterium]
MFSISALLISIGAITALTVVLAIILVVADAFIADYGECKVTVNGKKELTIKGGRTLLSSLMEEEIFIPSACGGRGSCGLCKVKVDSGAGQYLPTELPWISPEEKAENVRLSCQVKVKQDMSIRIPEELFSVKQYKTKVDSIRDLTHDIKEVRFRLPDSQTIDYKAGQFVQILTPEYKLSDEQVFRAYSMSSVPSEKNIIELEIRLVPEGICTTWVHQYLKEGDEVTINGPYGDFFLRDTDRDIICIAGGSGNAPIKSILLDMAEKGNNRKVSYFYGAQAIKDLVLPDEMAAISERLPNYRYIPVLSNPDPDDEWDGETGWVTDAVARHMDGGDNVEAYLCGSPGMIDACIKVLTEQGVPEELIFYDKFA